LTRRWGESATPDERWLADLNAAQERALEAADRYRARFGEPAPTWEFMGYPRELEAALNEDIERGEQVTAAQLYERFGLTPPPPGALL
jgi:hypothetical protein